MINVRNRLLNWHPFCGYHANERKSREDPGNERVYVTSKVFTTNRLRPVLGHFPFSQNFTFTLLKIEALYQVEEQNKLENLLSYT